MMFPQFLGNGAQKSGTTWLHQNLGQHPQIWLPPIKELHYLDHEPISCFKRLFGRSEQLRGARRYLRHCLIASFKGDPDANVAWAARYCLSERSDAWYGSLFPAIEGKIVGEVCPGYARLDAQKVGHVYGLMPKAKIIYLLRNPVERAWSQMAMHFRAHHGGAEYITEKAIVARLEKPKSALHGEYMRNLAAWETHYPPEQIFIGFFEELQNTPKDLWLRLCDFLGIDRDESLIPKDLANPKGQGRGEAPDPHFETLLARFYVDEVKNLHAKFSNTYTQSWVQYVKQRC
jgi:hypothetical protein